MATNNNKRKVKNRLAELRNRGVVLSQEKVGVLVGCNAATVSRDESGAPLTKKRIEAYAELYGVPTHELFFIAPTEETVSEPAAERAS